MPKNAHQLQMTDTDIRDRHLLLYNHIKSTSEQISNNTNNQTVDFDILELIRFVATKTF